VVLLVGIGLWRGIDYFMWRLEQNVRQDISEHVFRHMMRQSLDFHANNFSGSLVSQTNKLINGYIRIQDSTIYQVYPMLWGFVWATLILAPKAPLYSVFLVVLIVLFMAVSMLLARGIFAHLSRAAAAESKETGRWGILCECTGGGRGPTSTVSDTRALRGPGCGCNVGSVPRPSPKRAGERLTTFPPLVSFLTGVGLTCRPLCCILYTIR
jgi:ABC-type multidrug transport system fused ATPase/permease subunit